MATTERILVERLARLFKDNVWKLNGLLESMILDREPQFAVKLMKELNKMLEIETKLLTSFHLQTNGQTKRMNQELEQHLQFFVNHRQKDWPEQLATAEFAVNNKIHSVIKVSLFIGRELRIGVDIRKKGKVEKVTELVKKIKKVQEKVETALKKTQGEIKWYADKRRREAEEQKKGNKIML